MPHNEQMAIKTFFHLHKKMTFNPFSAIQKSYENGNIKCFAEIEDYAFKGYFPECNSLKILRENFSLFNMIRYSPLFVDISFDDNLSNISCKSLPTFSDPQEYEKFTNWYKNLPIKPWAVDSSDFIKKFEEEYLKSLSITPFDTMKSLIENKKLYSHRQIYSYVIHSKNSIAEEVFDIHNQRKLTANNFWNYYQDLLSVEDKLNKVNLTTKKYLQYKESSINHKVVYTSMPAIAKGKPEFLSVYNPNETKDLPQDYLLWEIYYKFIGNSQQRHSIPTQNNTALFNTYTENANKALIEVFKTFFQFYLKFGFFISDAKMETMLNNIKFFEQIEAYSRIFPESISAKIQV